MSRKRCPKCGSIDCINYQIWDPFDPPLYYIRCENCLFQTSTHKTEKEAIEEWNTEMPVSGL